VKVMVKTDKFMRIVGYYGAVSRMNDGKRTEQAKRKVMGE